MAGRCEPTTSMLRRRGLLALLAAYAPVSKPADSHYTAGAAPSSLNAACATPCVAAPQCQPLTSPPPQREVLAFHTAGASVWRDYDWAALTSIAVYGSPVDPHLLCTAHAHGVRVLMVCPAGCFGTDATTLGGKWGNVTFVRGWVNRSVQVVRDHGADGIFLDIETSPLSPLQATQLTEMVRRLADAMHAAQPSSLVTMASFQLGLLLPDCGATGLPDYAGLARAVDWLVVMNYDANPWRRADFANAPLPVVNRSLACYRQFGVAAENLVLAFPWYGFVYTCARSDDSGLPLQHDGQGARRCNATAAHTVGWACPAPNCTGVPGSATDHEEYCMQSLIDRAVQLSWNENTSTPFAYFYEGGSELRRLDFDDNRSLAAKYQLAESAGARGIAMWTANGVGNPESSSAAAQFWRGIPGMS